MTILAPIHHAEKETWQRMALRWSLAGLFILCAHGGAVYAALNWPHAMTAAGEPPAAVMIELSPLPVAPDAPQQEVAPGPEMVMSEAATPSESKDKPVEQEQPEPEARSESIEKPVETQKPEVQTEAVPELPDMPSAAAVLAQAAPPQEETPPEPKKKPEKPKKTEPKKQRSRASPNAPTTAAPKPVIAPRAAANAAPMAGMSSSASPATWRSMLMAHLNRHKRMPPGGGRGTSQVVFVIDRSGRVMSARLVRSSGSAALDQEAVTLARRASPVPPPPPNVGGGSITLSVPVRFSE